MLNLVLTPRILPDFRGGVHLFILPYAIGSVPCVPMSFTAESPRRHSASSLLLVVSVTDVINAFAGLTMDQLCAPVFFHSHYWYVVETCVIQNVSREYCTNTACLYRAVKLLHRCYSTAPL